MHRCPRRGEGGGRGIRARQPGDLMARADELGNDGGSDPAGRAGDEHAHEKPPDSRSRLEVCAGSMSVTVISIHVMSATVIIYDRRYGPVGAERARPPGAGGNGALRRAWVRADHGGGDRRAGGADGTDVL